MHPELCELARTPADVERIAKTGKRVILVGVENGYPMGDDLANLKTFYDRGARYMTLVHSAHNQLADSSTPTAEPMHNGLSELGKKAVAEMNRLGMMVDMSHASAKSFWDVIAVSKAPIIASHSGLHGAREERPQPRRRPAEGAGEERRRHPDRGARLRT